MAEIYRFPADTLPVGIDVQAASVLYMLHAASVTAVNETVGTPVAKWAFDIHFEIEQHLIDIGVLMDPLEDEEDEEGE